MAAQTGSIYISGIMIDSIEIPTTNMGFSIMTNSRKYPHIIATTTNNRK